MEVLQSSCLNPQLLIPIDYVLAHVSRKNSAKISVVHICMCDQEPFAHVLAWGEVAEMHFKRGSGPGLYGTADEEWVGTQLSL